MERPELNNTDPQIKAYIEYLEEKLRLRKPQSPNTLSDNNAESLPESALPDELPGNLSIITISQSSIAKRTPRHLYHRQHRGGMGVYDLDIPESDIPLALLTTTDQQGLLLFTSKARVFRTSASKLMEAQVRSKGAALLDYPPLESGETIVSALPERAFGYVALASKSGRIRCLRHHLFGEHLKQGNALYRSDEFGPLAAVCWTPGDADILMTSRKGQGIRFSEKSISLQGDWGLRLAAGDEVAAIASVTDASGVLFVGSDGRGIIRLMKGFAPNKALGGGGKIAFKTDDLAAAVTIEPDADVFMITRMTKIIRFPASEISETEAPVQGINCMSFRADSVTAVLVSGVRG